MVLTVWHCSAFVIFTGACAYYNWKAGVEHGVTTTLDVLQQSGVIDITDDRIHQTVNKIDKENNED